MFYFVDFCRLCLNFQGEFIDMCNDNIMEKVIACINGLEFDEKLPSLICNRCLEQLDKFFDFRNRCLQSEFLINGYVNKLQTGNTASKFILTKLKVHVSNDFGISNKRISKVNSENHIERNMNHKSVNIGDVNFQFPQFSNLPDDLQNSIFSEDEDDVFFEEEEEDEYDSQMQDNNIPLQNGNTSAISMHSLIKNEKDIKQTRELYSDIESHEKFGLDNNQQNNSQLNGFDELYGVQTSIMERVKLQKRKVQNKLPLSENISTNKESHKEGNTSIEGEINDTNKVEYQDYRSNILVYSVDEGTIHAPNIGERIINLNYELNQLKYNLLSYLKRSPLGSRCLAKINLMIDSIICNFKDRLKQNFEYNCDLQGFNLNMLETPEEILSNYKDFDKLENIAFDSNYDTLPKEISLVKSPIAFSTNEPETCTSHDDNISYISAFDANENKETQVRTVDIEDNLATHVVFNKSLFEPPPKNTCRKLKRQPVMNTCSRRISPIKLAKDKPVTYSVYTKPRKLELFHKDQDTASILKSLLATTNDAESKDKSLHNKVLKNNISALADHAYHKKHTITNNSNPMKDIKENLGYNDEFYISTSPSSATLNCQNETSLMSSFNYSHSVLDSLLSSTALNSQNETSATTFHNHDSFVDVYNTMEATPFAYSLFEKETIIDNKAIVVENVDLLQDFNMPYYNKNESDNLYLDQNINEEGNLHESSKSLNTSLALIASKKNNTRLQDIVESAKYKIRKKKPIFIYDDPLNILKTTKRRKTKKNPRKRSGTLRRNVHVTKKRQPKPRVDIKKPPIKEDSEDSEIDVVTVPEGSQAFPYLNSLQRNEAERQRRQEIRTSQRMLHDIVHDKVVTDVLDQKPSMSSTVISACKCIRELEKECETNKLECTRLSIKQNELQARLDFLLQLNK